MIHIYSENEIESLGEIFKKLCCLEIFTRTDSTDKKENSFALKKTRSKRYSAKTITGADYVDDLVVLTSTSRIPTSYPEGTIGGIGLYVNTNEKKFMCFKEEKVISSLS